MGHPVGAPRASEFLYDSDILIAENVILIHPDGKCVSLSIFYREETNSVIALEPSSMRSWTYNIAKPQRSRSTDWAENIRNIAINYLNNNSNHTIEKDHSCKCEIMLLMTQGCQCGGK